MSGDVAPYRSVGKGQGGSSEDPMPLHGSGVYLVRARLRDRETPVKGVLLATMGFFPNSEVTRGRSTTTTEGKPYGDTPVSALSGGVYLIMVKSP